VQGWTVNEIPSTPRSQKTQFSGCSDALKSREEACSYEPSCEVSGSGMICRASKEKRESSAGVDGNTHHGPPLDAGRVRRAHDPACAGTHAEHDAPPCPVPRPCTTRRPQVTHCSHRMRVYEHAGGHTRDTARTVASGGPWSRRRCRREH